MSIEYKNQQTQQTKYWVAIRGLNPRTRTLNVDGLHLGKLSVQALDHISICLLYTSWQWVFLIIAQLRAFSHVRFYEELANFPVYAKRTHLHKSCNYCSFCVIISIAFPA